MPVYIYGLVDPRTGEVRYVGKSTDPERRLCAHLCPGARKKRTRKARWLRELHALGLRPGLSILEETDDSGWEEAERRWIASMLASGHNLCNETPGGEAGPTAERVLSQRRKVPLSEIPRIRERAANGETITALAERYGVSIATVSLLVSGKNGKMAGGPVSTIDRRSLRPFTSAETAQSARGGKPRGEQVHLAKLTEAAVVEMRRLYAEGASARQLRARFGVDVTAVLNAVRGRTWAHVPGSVPVRSTVACAKLPADAVQDICQRAASGEGHREIAASYGVSRSTVSMVVSGKNRKRLPAITTS